MGDAPLGAWEVGPGENHSEGSLLLMCFGQKCHPLALPFEGYFRWVYNCRLPGSFLVALRRVISLLSGFRCACGESSPVPRRSSEVVASVAALRSFVFAFGFQLRPCAVSRCGFLRVCPAWDCVCRGGAFWWCRGKT